MGLACFGDLLTQRTTGPEGTTFLAAMTTSSSVWAAGFVDTDLSFLSFLTVYRTDVAQG